MRGCGDPPRTVSTRRQPTPATFVRFSPRSFPAWAGPRCEHPRFARAICWVAATAPPRGGARRFCAGLAAPCTCSSLQPYIAPQPGSNGAAAATGIPLFCMRGPTFSSAGPSSSKLSNHSRRSYAEPSFPIRRLHLRVAGVSSRDERSRGRPGALRRWPRVPRMQQEVVESGFRALRSAQPRAHASRPG